MIVPDFFAFRVSSHNPIYNRRLTSFRMSVLLSDRVYLDVLRIIHVNKLFIRIRTIRPWMA
jgi:hypothetical protein